MAYPVMPLGFLGSQGDNDTYRIERSLRFNSADSAYLNRTPASAGNRRTWTLSCWVKRSKLGNDATILDAGSNDQIRFLIGSDRIRFNFQNVIVRETNAVYRDVSSWYHIVLTVDTSNATANDRIKIYVNGSEVTSFATLSNPSQNAEGEINSTSSHAIGRVGSGSYYFDGYITEYHFVDGQALTPSSFGETDPITGRWKAKAYSGTYGTNGFYLNFADNSGTTSTTLGKDSSGNGNNWTPNNFSVTAGAGNDSLVDSPTNYGTDTGVGGEVRGNYCTLNPLDKLLSPTLVNGNLDATVGDNAEIRGAIYVSSGKWYWEVVPTTMNHSMIGVGVGGATKHWGTTGISYYGTNGNKYVNGTPSAYGASYTNNDVIGVALDIDNLQITFYKNNVSQGAITGLTAGSYAPALSAAGNSSVYVANFGQRPFAYTAPAGFKALCTTNLPTPTIQNPSKYMDVVTYTGTGSALTPTSSLGFSPDIVWLKGRSGATDHAIYDSVRGVQLDLSSNLTSAETTQSQGLTAFNSNGFTIGTLAKINTNTSTYVAWAWDEAPIAGMDIVSYTGNGTNRTIAHSLGVAPKMMIVRNRNSSLANNWQVYHASLTSASYRLRLNTTDAQDLQTGMWNSTAPTSSVFSVGTQDGVNENGKDIIAYLFAEVEGFSKFGSYTGNGSSDGPFVWCGFRPRWVMIKDTAGAINWRLLDTSRDTFNLSQNGLFPNTSGAESTTNMQMDILSNGFKIRATADINANGNNHIFAAFAESPFKYARAR